MGTENQNGFRNFGEKILKVIRPMAEENYC